MTKTYREAKYVCDLTKDDINLHMAELASAVNLEPLLGGGTHYAQEALDNLQSLTVAVHVWAKAQRKIEKAEQPPEIFAECQSDGRY